MCAHAERVAPFPSASVTALTSTAVASIELEGAPPYRLPLFFHVANTFFGFLN